MHKRLRWSQASKDTQDLNTRLGRRQREIVSMFAEVHLPSSLPIIISHSPVQSPTQSFESR